VVREYVGHGRVVESLAKRDALERDKRRMDAERQRAERAELETLDADLDALGKLVDMLARAALLAAGYHQHKRGEWRKRREHQHKRGEWRKRREQNSKSGTSRSKKK
jgi:hypothetical protein